MKDIKIVIGASYGDEGKGLATDFFAKEAVSQNKNPIVVLHNGGFQRGHTVKVGDIRHIFHAFGSGTLRNVPTYYASTFILNPMFFRQEYEELTARGITPKVYANPKCRITSLYDVMINQIVEDFRDANRHSSCGYGIFETVVRDRTLPLRLGDILAQNDIKNYIFSFYNYYRDNYFAERLRQYKVDKISMKMVKNVVDVDIQNKYVEDLIFMLEHIDVKETQFISEYDYIIFEGSQGLLLDNDRPTNKDFLTPSKTGVHNPLLIIKDLKALGFLDDTNIETCYVTRTYLTRHGNGEFPQECRKENINSEMVDATNAPNHYQGSLRYGYIDLSELGERIKGDVENKSEALNPCIFVTHLNETDGCFIEKYKKVPVRSIKKVKYVSDKEYN